MAGIGSILDGEEIYKNGMPTVAWSWLGYPVTEDEYRRLQSAGALSIHSKATLALREEASRLWTAYSKAHDEYQAAARADVSAFLERDLQHGLAP